MNRKTVKEFRNVTSTTEKVAKEFLSRHGYKLEVALEAFYDNSGNMATVSKKGNAANISKIFDKYEGDEKDVLCEDKMAEFFTAVGVDIDGAGPMVVSWKLRAESFGEISRKEFVDGFSAVNCDTMPKMKDTVKRWLGVLSCKSDQFKQFYRWLFEYAKETSERKTLDKDQAVELWVLALTESIFPLYQEYIQFINDKADVKTVTKDLWEMSYEFACEMNADLSNYQDDGAWPLTIDEFVEHMQEKKG